MPAVLGRVHGRRGSSRARFGASSEISSAASPTRYRAQMRAARGSQPFFDYDTGYRTLAGTEHDPVNSLDAFSGTRRPVHEPGSRIPLDEVTVRSTKEGMRRPR